MLTRSRRDRLAQAWEHLVALPFPDHPDDPDLSDWLLDLAELDGHVAGLAKSALAGASVPSSPRPEVDRHARLLDELRVVGDDEEIYLQCQIYVDALAGVAEALSDEEDLSSAPNPDVGPGGQQL